MENILKKIGKISSFVSRYIGIIIIAFSCLAFFWRDGFAWMTNYTSVFLGVIMFGMGLTIRLEDFRAIFSRPKEVIIGAVAQYTIMPVVAWVLCKVMNLPADLALGVILVGCCPGGTASNVITYIAGGDVALSVGMTIVSTLAAPVMTPFLVYILAGAWVEVSFWAMVLSVVKVILIPVLLGILLRTLAGDHVDKVSDVMPLISVVAIVMINTALYITSNLVIYFFKYDFSPEAWQSNYTLFNTFGGAFQILAMMILFPLLRKFMNTIKIFYVSFSMAFAGYLILLVIAFSESTSVYLLLVPAFLIMSAMGMLNVIVTIFLANTVDYGELKNNRRDESVIFSMQTFVVKLASGVAALAASIVIQIFQIKKDETAEVLTAIAPVSRLGLRMCMTIIPILVLLIGLLVFRKHYILTDEKTEEISRTLEERKRA